MDVVDQWTGRHACALQVALRMTHEELAEYLGVARRTVAAWHERPDVVLRTEMQRALDTAYEGASESAKVRFARRLQADDNAEVETTKAEAGVVPLTVAVAIVVTDAEVLIVCRRDADPSGITWQFPAGVVKPGSTASTVAIRETLAETGVHCAVRKELGGRLHPLSAVYCEYFLCDYLTGDVENRDISENVSAIWVPRADLTRFIPADTIFPAVLRELEEVGLQESTDSQPPISAAVIVVDGRVLMVRRRVKEGQLSWQFPAGKVELDESGEEAAVREAREEVGLTVDPIKTLGQRVHPATGRMMIYVACSVVDGTARVADEDELVEAEWCDRATLAEYVPYPFFEPVQEYLDEALK